MARRNLRRCRAGAATIAVLMLAVAGVATATAGDIASKVAAAEQAIRLGDLVRATTVLEELARHGHGPSQYRLASLYRTGANGKPEPREAFGWMQAAARSGDARAMRELARMLKQGFGTKTDPVAARRWLEKAAAAGDGDAVRELATPAPDQRPRYAGSPPENAKAAGVGQTARGAVAGMAPDLALRDAARRGLAETIRRILAKHGSVLDTADEHGRTALMLAAEHGSVPSVRALVRSGASVTRTDRKGDTALVLAARGGFAGVVEEILAAKRQDVISERDRIAAAWAAGLGCHEAALHKLWPSSRPLPAAQDGRTLSMYAAAACGAGLLSRAAALSPVDAVDTSGRTALWYAADVGREQSVEVLIARGAAVDMADREGSLALHRALAGGHGKAALPLIAATSTPEHLSRDGNTPLMLAAANGLEPAVAALLARKVAIDTRNRSGMSALMLAARSGHTAVVHRLLGAGADKGLRNMRRERAADIAQAMGRNAIAAMLAKH